jgi:hypothetical protein
MTNTMKLHAWAWRTLFAGSIHFHHLPKCGRTAHAELVDTLANNEDSALVAFWAGELAADLIGAH